MGLNTRVGTRKSSRSHSNFVHFATSNGQLKAAFE